MSILRTVLIIACVTIASIIYAEHIDSSIDTQARVLISSMKRVVKESCKAENILVITSSVGKE